MNARTRYPLALAALLLSGGALPALDAGPASASETWLCYGYAACQSAGMSSAGYDRNNSHMYWLMYAGHNCTNYAAYRMVLSGMPNVRPWSGDGNAMNWGVANKSITDQTPTVGAVAWWKAYVYPAGSVGHVAYVEKVISPTEIIVSQDSWGGDFSWADITKSGSGWPSGFVHFNDRSPTETTPPSVTGTAQVGSVLTASAGTWRPSGVTTTYQWKAGRKRIPGATGPTFTLTPAQLGRHVRVVVRASALGYATTRAKSDHTDAVAPGVLTTTSAPRVTGTPTVDQPLTVQPGTWNVTPESVTYQWFADGTPIDGATDTTFTPDAGFVGQTLSVTATAHLTAYDDGVVTAQTSAPVAPGTLVPSTGPAIAGTPKVGRALTVTTGQVAPDATPTIRWLRDGNRIHGATDPTYQLTRDDLGTRISVRVVWTRPGYTTLRDRAPHTTPIAPAR